ncbi:hypothetical protein J437_LFUL005427 [Ladona fulva]|uniref:Uncharacterized protein n=1 Tax=Ladona fulva TaxID=123851 RepID=A0A8K0NXX1_LADFU|nr:hypothetical protein J437_LFUL005427 [Ladona fulva]
MPLKGTRFHSGKDNAECDGPEAGNESMYTDLQKEYSTMFNIIISNHGKCSTEVIASHHELHFVIWLQISLEEQFLELPAKDFSPYLLEAYLHILSAQEPSHLLGASVN